VYARLADVSCEDASVAQFPKVDMEVESRTTVDVMSLVLMVVMARVAVPAARSR